MPIPVPPIIPYVCQSVVSVPINVDFDVNDIANGNAKGYFYQNLPPNTQKYVDPNGNIDLQGVYSCVKISIKIQKDTSYHLRFSSRPLDHPDDPPNSSQFGDVYAVSDPDNKVGMIYFSYRNDMNQIVRKDHRYILHIIGDDGKTYDVNDPIIHNTGPPPQAPTPNLLLILGAIILTVAVGVLYKLTFARSSRWFRRE